MRISFLLAAISTSFVLNAQPPQVPLYSIDNVTLPESLNKQVCISGMK